MQDNGSSLNFNFSVPFQQVRKKNYHFFGDDDSGGRKQVELTEKRRKLSAKH